MLEIGNGGQTVEQYITHMSLWCLAKAPLLIGCDVSTLTPHSQALQILSNAEAIAINQDPLGVQGKRLLVNSTANTEVWAGPLANGDVAVVLVNLATHWQPISVNWTTVGFSSPDGHGYVRDLWAHKTFGPFSAGYTAPVVLPESVAFLRVSASAPVSRGSEKWLGVLK